MAGRNADSAAGGCAVSLWSAVRRGSPSTPATFCPRCRFSSSPSAASELPSLEEPEWRWRWRQSLLAYTVVSSLSIYPHSLSYFNELAAVLPTPADASYPKPYEEHGEHGGLWPTIKDAVAAGPRNGPRHLLDSNIDWGQDLYLP